MIGFIDVATAELAKLVDYVITYPANEQLKFYMVADRFYVQCRRISRI